MVRSYPGSFSIAGRTGSPRSCRGSAVRHCYWLWQRHIVQLTLVQQMALRLGKMRAKRCYDSLNRELLDDCLANFEAISSRMLAEAVAG